MYQWDDDMEAALQIAMNYLDGTGQTQLLKDASISAAIAVAEARKAGIHHRIGLANAAIKSVERETAQQQKADLGFLKLCD